MHLTAPSQGLHVNPFAIGSLLGLGAALVGVSPLFIGLRPWHILVIGTFVLIVVRCGASALLRLRVTAIDIVFLVFILVSAGVEYFNGEQLDYSPGLVSVFSDFFYILAYLCARMTVFDLPSCLAFLRGLVWPALPVSVLAFLQILGVGFIIDFSLMIAPTEAVDNRIAGGSFARAWGLTGHWTGFGGYVTCIVAALMCLIIIRSKSDGGVRNREIFMIGVLFLGALSTLTMSVIFSCLAIVLISWRHLKSGLKGIVALLIFGLTATLALMPFISVRLDQQFAPAWTTQNLPGWVPSTLAYRWIIWSEETIPAIMSRPYMGWGAGVYNQDTVGRQYPLQLDWGSSESQWLGITVSYGVWVGIVFVFLLLLAGRVFQSLRRGAFGVRFEPLFVLWIALIMTSFTVSIFTNRGTPAVFYILLGCAAAMRDVPIGPLLSNHANRRKQDWPRAHGSAQGLLDI